MIIIVVCLYLIFTISVEKRVTVLYTSIGPIINLIIGLRHSINYSKIYFTCSLFIVVDFLWPFDLEQYKQVEIC